MIGDPTLHRTAFSGNGAVKFWAEGSRGSIYRRSDSSKIGKEILHPRPIRGAIFSRNGERLLIADDEEIVVRDVETGKTLGPPITQMAPWRIIHFSDDGERLLTVGADDIVMVWDTLTGDCVLDGSRPPIGTGGHDDSIKIDSKGVASLSPDGRTIACWIPEKYVVAAYRVDDRKLLLTTDQHRGWPVRIRFSRDSRRFIFGSSDTRARVWDVATGKPAGPILRHSSFVRQVGLGTGRLAVTVDGHGKVSVFEVSTGEPVVTYRNDDSTPMNLMFAEDDSHLVAYQGRWIRIPLPKPIRGLSDAYVELLCSAEIDQSNSVAAFETTRYLTQGERYLEAFRTAQRDLPNTSVANPDER